MPPHSPPALDALFTILESAGDLILVADWDTASFVDANDATLERLGYTMAELRQMNGGDLSEFPREEHRRFSQELIELGQTHVSAVPVRCKGGALLRMDLWVRKFSWEGTDYNLTLMRDAHSPSPSVHRFAVGPGRLKESEAFYRGVVGCTQDAVVVYDPETGELIEVNPAACKLFGYTSAEFRSVPYEALFVRCNDVPPGGSGLEGTGSARTNDTLLTRKDLTTFVADVAQNSFESEGRHLVVLIIRDVSEQKRQRLHMERSQRLVAVGEVAAGVAHEINNPAAFIEMNSEVIEAQVSQLASFHSAAQVYLESETDPAKRSALEALFAKSPDLGAIQSTVRDNREGIERIRAVSRDLRLFARSDEQAVVEEHLNSVVHGALKLVGNELRHRATLHLDLSEDLPVFPAWSGKLSQVATNLLLNAVQSITEGNVEGNSIRVITRRVDDDLLLIVEDTGGGIDEETMMHVFKPFFTTKSPEQGTGLGLPLCARIVEEHGGRIEVTSAVGEGTRFEVHIPLETGLRVSALPAETPVRNVERGRILVIDDDPGMVRAYRRMLRRHDTTVVSSGAEALAILAENDDFDLVLCDLMMPEIDGLQVYASLMASAPHVARNIVFCTGGAFTSRARSFLEAVENEVVEKPLSHEDVGRLLGRARS